MAYEKMQVSNIMSTEDIWSSCDYIWRSSYNELEFLLVETMKVSYCYFKQHFAFGGWGIIIAALSKVWSGRRTCRGVAEWLVLRTCITVVTQKEFCRTGSEQKKWKKALFL